MPRGGVEGSVCQKTESNCKLPAAGPLRLSPRQSKVYLPVPSPRTRPLTPVESIRTLPGSWYQRPRRRRGQLLIKEKVNSLKETEQTTLKGKSREIKNVTLVSVGEMRFTR